MKSLKHILIVVVVLLVAYFFINRPQTVPAPVVSSDSTFTYMCNEGKTVAVLQGKDGIQVTLSDGRSFALPHSPSADGTRYANKDESFVFWSKGNGALVLENNVEKSHIGCILIAKDPGGLPQVYASGAHGFSIRLPAGYIVDEKDGIKFSVPKSLIEETNLSSDTYISIRSIPQNKTCSATIFLNREPAKEITEGDITYSVASSSDAAAGNRYEEIVYVLPWTHPCLAIYYRIHWGVFENYPEGSIKEFDKAALIKTFDAIRKTLIINQ